jgi:ComF family protein
VTEQGICSNCYRHLPRTGFGRQPLDNVMARMFWGQMEVERAAALFFFEPGSEAAQLVYEMKYGDHPELAVDMGRMMGKELALTAFFDTIDLIIPIPLARKRERQRGYNQSRCLAQGLSQATGLPVCDRAVKRTAFKISQTHIGRWERQENVADVFKVTDAEAIGGRHVLLVDDVVTTGATVTACGRELLKAGAAKLSILSLGFTGQWTAQSIPLGDGK